MKKLTFARFVLSLCAMAMPVANAGGVALQQATATFSQISYGVDKAIDGITTDPFGWGINPQITSQTATFETSSDIGFSGGSLLTFTLIQSHTNSQHTLGHFRISVTTDSRDAFSDGLTSGGDVTANWSILNPDTLLSANGATLNKLGDNSILASGFSPGNDIYTLTATTAFTGITGIRIEALEDPSLPFGGPGRFPSNGNFVLTELQVNITPASTISEPSTWLLLLAGGGISWLVTRQHDKAHCHRAQ